MTGELNVHCASESEGSVIPAVPESGQNRTAIWGLVRVVHQNLITFGTARITLPSLSEDQCVFISPVTLQNYAKSIALDEEAFKMGLDVQFGALGAENEHFRKNTRYFCLFFCEMLQPP